ncbi:hypothetical protein DFH11DRAFT_1512887 [Phellopilus nigrolimitatus]|nr:hypothetical protein DFH11DRAFT_1512887 [Phellopilus nigrolimitatus]
MSARRSRRKASATLKQPAAIDDDTHRSLECVRERVAEGIAFKTVNAAETIDGVKVGVALTLSLGNDREPFLRHVVAKIQHILQRKEYLFVVAPGPPHAQSWPVLIVASSPHLLNKAATLACAKFLGRIRELRTEAECWLGHIDDVGTSSINEAMLWDIVRKTSHVVNPKMPPRGARSIALILDAARTRLERLKPLEALNELHDLAFPLPVVLVDIRATAVRAAHGEIPDALIVDRGVLEWQFDPRSETRLSIADRYDLRIIVVDQKGLASSLAAASLHDLGLLNATDIIGGFEAWKAAGLPTS